MPRHRIEAARSRTLWPAALQSARRVPVRAASHRATPGHARPVVTPEWRRRLVRAQRRALKRAGRRLLVSPWFAVGAGVVIATGAVLYAPHSNVDFGRAISVIPCKTTRCEQETPQSAVRVPAGQGTRLTTSPSPTAVLAGMTFTYQVVAQDQYEFAMQITIRAQHGLGPWKLSLVIPGARNVYVVPSPGVRSDPSGTDGISGDGGPYGDTAMFQIRGTGTAAAPADCTFNGTACQFTRSPSQPRPSWPGSG